ATRWQAGDDGGGTRAEQRDREAEVTTLAWTEACDPGEDRLDERAASHGVGEGVRDDRLGDGLEDHALGRGERGGGSHGRYIEAVGGRGQLSRCVRWRLARGAQTAHIHANVPFGDGWRGRDALQGAD